MFYFDKRVEVNDVWMPNEGRPIVTMTAIVNYFQNCCLFQSEDLNVGLDYLTENKLVWVLNSWQIEVDRFPKYAEKIKVYTNPYDIKGFFGYRNFHITDQDENIICKANSVWTLLSTENMMPVRDSGEFSKAYKMGQKLDMEYKPRKIDVPEDGELKDEVIIKRHHIDVNGHVNNGQYIAIASECLPGDFIPNSMRAEYKRQVMLGETLCPYVVRVDDDTVVVALKDKSDSYATIIEFKKV